MKHGKKYVDGAKLVDRSNLYDSAEALDLSLKLNMPQSVNTYQIFCRPENLTKLLSDFPTKVQVAENLKYIIWI